MNKYHVQIDDSEQWIVKGDSISWKNGPLIIHRNGKPVGVFFVWRCWVLDYEEEEKQ